LKICHLFVHFYLCTRVGGCGNMYPYTLPDDRVGRDKKRNDNGKHNLRHSHHVSHVSFIPSLVSKGYVSCFCHVRTSPVQLYTSHISVSFVRWPDTWRQVDVSSRQDWLQVTTKEVRVTENTWVSVDWMSLNIHLKKISVVHSDESCRSKSSPWLSGQSSVVWLCRWNEESWMCDIPCFRGAWNEEGAQNLKWIKQILSELYFPQLHQIRQMTWVLTSVDVRLTSGLTWQLRRRRVVGWVNLF
jgi:hypothetical protein